MAFAALAPLIGMLAAGGLSGLGGSGARTSSTFNRGQRGAINDVLQAIKGMKGGQQDVTQNPQYQQGNEWLMSLFNDPEFFNQFEAPIQRQFQEQTIPELANRFASMGSGGSLGSTAFRNQANREAGNLSTNLAAQRGQMQQNAIPQLFQSAQQPASNLMGLRQLALGQGVNNQYQPPSAGFFGPIASSFAGGLAQQYGQQMGRGFPGQSPSTF